MSLDAFQDTDIIPKYSVSRGHFLQQIVENVSFHLPMPALVGANATEASLRLQIREVLLHCLTGNPQGSRHANLRQMRLRLEQLGQTVNRFLTTFF